MRARRIVAGAALALVAMTRVAVADPAPTLEPPINLHLLTPSTVRTDGGMELHLPPVFILDERLRWELDDEMKRLQDQETRLTAENESLRTAAKSWQPGWYTLALAVAGGIALGWYANSKL